MPSSKTNSDYNFVFSETKKLAEELLKSPDYAQKAVHDRNVIIRGLKADIAHRAVVFDEIESRYNDFSDQNEELHSIIDEMTKELVETKNKLASTTAELNTVTVSYKIEKSLNDEIWYVKFERLTSKLTGWRGSLIRIMLSRQVSQYIVLGLFVMLFIASFTGWGFVVTAVQPIITAIKLFF